MQSQPLTGNDTAGQHSIGRSSAHTHVAKACDEYPCVLQSQPLTEDDLQLICKLGGLMLMRRTDEPISHEEALQEAVSLATQWLQHSDEPISSVDGASSTCLRLLIVPAVLV